MNEISRNILKAIHQNMWLKIEYKNKEEQITKFMIGINKIIPSKKLFICDAFNITYNKDVSEEYFIHFDGILSCEICEETFHKTPEKLLEEIRNNWEEYSFLNSIVNKNDILDYYCDCFMLDNVPYISKFELIKGIDDSVVMKNNSYSLSDEQFEQFSKKIFYDDKKKENKEEKFKLELGINVLSIKLMPQNMLYVLAYRPIKVDLKEKKLVPSENIFVNKEFDLDPASIQIKMIESAHRYLPEEDYNLLEDFENNAREIEESIKSYNESRTASYRKEVKTDNRPFFINLERRFSVDIKKELSGIKKAISNEEELSLPIKLFFGDLNVKFPRKVTHPIFTINDQYNPDQINAINYAMNSTAAASYIQGPPGTGKTQTLLNLILTAYFNDMTCLVTSNNNIPMDGVYEDICNLKYKEDKLLFPAIRLGNMENVDAAIDRIKIMYEKALEMTPKEQMIKRIKEERKSSMKDLSEFLNKYDSFEKKKAKKDSMEYMLSKISNDNFMSVKLNAQIEALKEEMDKEAIEDLYEFKQHMHQDYRYLYMAIHFDTALRLQKLKRAEFNELMSIINLPVTTNKEREDRAREFKRYLSSDINLAKFQKIFPVIISTNLSCVYLGGSNINFDFVMMDEAGQCNVANALIPICRGKRVVLIGDPQQLRPVILLDENHNKLLMKKYNISKEYNYILNSIYTTFTSVDVTNNEALLSYHYRCHDKIIGFSNKKYYKGKLKLEAKSIEAKPLEFVNTEIADNKLSSNEKNVSDIEAKHICEYIKSHPDKKVGVITPFVKQKDCIEYYLKQNKIDNVSVGTVHAFQGDQKDIIIFSTAVTKNTHASTYNWLKCNKELINVAVSRARDKLIILGNKSAIQKLSKDNDDLKELFDYIEKEGDSYVTDVSIPSIALGTRQLSTESEKELAQTVEHVLSVITTDDVFLVEQVSLSKIFNNDNVDNAIFFKQNFDLVIYQKIYGGESLPLLAIELNGPEHSSDPIVINRDKYKEKYCKMHDLELIKIPRDCARDYINIKETLKEFIKTKKEA